MTSKFPHVLKQNALTGAASRVTAMHISQTSPSEHFKKVNKYYNRDMKSAIEVGTDRNKA
jgi:hypothetical protein